VHPDGQPHVVPLLAVVVDGIAGYSSPRARSRLSGWADEPGLVRDDDELRTVARVELGE
jgi:hypothetical protein